MHPKAERYVVEALAHTGFAILSPMVAYRLRPDILRSASDAGFAFNGLDLVKDLSQMGALAFYRARLQEVGEAVVVARSGKRLAERIEELTGLAVLSLEPFQPEPRPANEVRTIPPIRMGDEERQRLQAIADRPLPAHDCGDRREILEARRRLAELDAVS